MTIIGSVVDRVVEDAQRKAAPKPPPAPDPAAEWAGGSSIEQQRPAPAPAPGPQPAAPEPQTDPGQAEREAGLRALQGFQNPDQVQQAAAWVNSGSIAAARPGPIAQMAAQAPRITSQVARIPMNATPSAPVPFAGPDTMAPWRGDALMDTGTNLEGIDNSAQYDHLTPFMQQQIAARRDAQFAKDNPTPETYAPQYATGDFTDATPPNPDPLNFAALSQTPETQTALGKLRTRLGPRGVQALLASAVVASAGERQGGTYFDPARHQIGVENPTPTSNLAHEITHAYEDQFVTPAAREEFQLKVYELAKAGDEVARDAIRKNAGDPQHIFTYFGDRLFAGKPIPDELRPYYEGLFKTETDPLHFGLLAQMAATPPSRQQQAEALASPGGQRALFGAPATETEPAQPGAIDMGIGAAESGLANKLRADHNRAVQFLNSIPVSALPDAIKQTLLRASERDYLEELARNGQTTTEGSPGSMAGSPHLTALQMAAQAAGTPFKLASKALIAGTPAGPLTDLIPGAAGEKVRGVRDVAAGIAPYFVPGTQPLMLAQMGLEGAAEIEAWKDGRISTADFAKGIGVTAATILGITLGGAALARISRSSKLVGGPIAIDDILATPEGEELSRRTLNFDLKDGQLVLRPTPVQRIQGALAKFEARLKGKPAEFQSRARGIGGASDEGIDIRKAGESDFTPARTPGENPVTPEDIVSGRGSSPAAGRDTGSLANEMNSLEGELEKARASTSENVPAIEDRLTIVTDELRARADAGDKQAARRVADSFEPVAQDAPGLPVAQLGHVIDGAIARPAQHATPAERAPVEAALSEMMRRYAAGDADAIKFMDDIRAAQQTPKPTSEPMRVAGADAAPAERPTFLPERMTPAQAKSLLESGMLSAKEAEAVKRWVGGPGVSGAERYPSEFRQPLPPRKGREDIAVPDPSYEPPRRPEMMGKVDKFVEHQLTHVARLGPAMARHMTPGVTKAVRAVAAGKPGARIDDMLGPSGRPMTAQQVVDEHKMHELVDYERTRTWLKPVATNVAKTPRQKITRLGIEGEKGSAQLQPAADTAKEYLAGLKPNPKGAKGWMTLPNRQNALAGRAIESARDLEKTRKHVEELVQKGLPGRFWYEHAGTEILDAHGGDKLAAKRFVGTLALLSNSASVESNSATALRVINQWAAGAQITGAGTADQVAKLRAFLDNPSNAGKLKTNAFYMALLRIIDHEEWARLHQGLPTVDVHIGRAYGYDVGTRIVGGKEMDRAISESQYRFPAADILRIERKLQQDDPSWTYDQVQAAMWTGQKSLTQKAGVEQAAVHYGDILKRHMAQVSTESAPGETWRRKNGGQQLEGYEEAPRSVQDAYHAAKAAVVAPDGIDRIARMLGLPQGGASTEPGIFAGTVHPSTQQRVYTSTEMGGVQSGMVGPEARSLLDVLASAHGMINHQDAAAWHRMFPVKEIYRQNAVELVVGRSLTNAEALRLEGALKAEGHDVAVVGAPTGAHILDLHRQALAPGQAKYLQKAATEATRAFQHAVKNAVDEQLPKDAKLTGMGYDSGYIENDWREGARGYLGTIQRSGLPEAKRNQLLDSLGRLSRESGQVDSSFAKEQGWKYDGPAVERPFRPAERFPSEFAPAPPPVKSVPFELRPGEKPEPEKFDFAPSEEHLAHLMNLVEHGDWTTTPGARINAKATINRLLRGEAPTDKEFALLQRVFSSTGKAPAPSTARTPSTSTTAQEHMTFGARARGLTPAEAAIAAQTGALPSKGAQPRLLGSYPPETIDRMVKGAMKSERPDRRMALFYKALSPLAMARATKASWDIGWGGRNGWRLFPSDPKSWFRMYREQIKVFRSQAAFDALEAETRAFPIYARSQALKTPLAMLEFGSTDIEKTPEEFIGTAFGKMPFGGLGLTASDRAYIGPGNWLRMKRLQDMADTVEDLQGHEITDHDLQELVHLLNSATLRGKTDWLEIKDVVSAKTIASLLFSLKGKVSGPQFLLDAARTYGDSQTSPEAKNIIRKTVRAYLGLGLGLLGAVAATGYVLGKQGKTSFVKVNMDRHSSGFGDIDVHGFRWNFWGADRAMLRLAFQLAEARETKLGSPTKDASRLALATNYAAGQLAPGLPKLIWDIFVNKGVSRSGESYGKPIFSLKGGALYLVDQYAPIGPLSTYDTYQAKGLGMAAATLAAEVQGFSTSSYGTAASDAADTIDRAGIAGGIEKGDIHELVELRETNPAVRAAWGPNSETALAHTIRARVKKELTQAGLPDKDEALIQITHTKPGSGDNMTSDQSWLQDFTSTFAEVGVRVDGVTALTGQGDTLKTRYIAAVVPQLQARDGISYEDAKDKADKYWEQIPVIKDFTDTIADAVKDFWTNNPKWLMTAYDSGEKPSLDKDLRAIYDAERERRHPQVQGGINGKMPVGAQ